MESVYKLARGTVRLGVSGAEPEKLLNLCAERGIKFWDTEPKHDCTINLTAWASDLPEITALCEKALCESKLLSSRGGRRIGAALKRRIGFGIGCAVCVILLAVSSLYVWDIEIVGNSTVSDGKILSALEECGLGYGTMRLNLSSDMLRSRVLMKLPELSWLTVNINNSRAEVIVHERIEKPEMIDESKCIDVIAAKTGIITKVSALEGKTVCAVGDTVVRGETLISGTMDSETGDDRFVHARGEIEARTWYEKTAEAPLYEYIKTGNGKTEHNISVHFGKNRINFFSDSRNLCSGCDKIIKYRNAALKNVFALPVGIDSEKCTVRYLEKRTADEKAVRERLEQTLSEELKADIGDGTVTECNFSAVNDGEKLIVTLRAECLEDISEEVFG